MHIQRFGPAGKNRISPAILLLLESVTVSSGDGRLYISRLLKILYSAMNSVYDCKYCVNRRSNDRPRGYFYPGRSPRLTMEFYRRNYIEGLFLSSGVRKSPEYTMETNL